ncbi:MAG: DUF3667 domain-containing protein [Myxococcota bacterium]
MSTHRTSTDATSTDATGIDATSTDATSIDATSIESVPQCCRNCEAPLVGPYCAECGQKDAEVARPFTSLLADFFESTFSLDSRVARTAVLLLAFPGRLTRAYFDGQRARYLPPLRLFLVGSLMFFAILGVTDRHLLRIVVWRSAVEGEASPAPKTDEDSGYSAKLTMFSPADEPSHSNLRQEDVDRILSEPKLPGFGRRLVRSFQRAITDPQSFNASLNVWIPRMMFLLVPVFALVVRLFYWGKGRYLAHHVFFALHFHTFIFVLLTTLVALVPSIGGSLGFLVFAVGIGLYLLVSMKTAYGQSWLVTVLKWWAVWTIYTGIFFVALGVTVLAAVQQL